MNEYHKKLFNDFLEYESLRGRRVRGVLVTKSALPKFLHYLEDMDLKFNEVRFKEATEFQGYLIKNGRLDGTGYRTNTVKIIITSARCFYEYLKKKGIVLTNPFTEIKRLPDEERIPRNILKENELNDLLSGLRDLDEFKEIHKRISRYKTHVASELMYSTGLRIAEAAALKADDIDFTRGIVHVRGGKGGESRAAYLNEYTKEILRIYVDKMQDLILNKKNKNKDTLFGVDWHTLMEMISDELKIVCKKLNLPKQTTHNFRHSLGTHLLRAGCDIRYVQEILGHKRLQNTEVYTKVDKKDLRRFLDKYHPRKFKKPEDKE